MTQLPAPISIAAPSRQPMAPCPVRRALLVAGVSRSGTSVLTRLLHTLGAATPKALLGAGHGNPTGHWEPKALVALNDEILSAMGMTWQDPRPIPRAWFFSQAAYDFQCRVMRQIQNDYGSEPLIVLKDPRVARLLPLYLASLDSLNIEPLVILPVRSPSEVIASLVNRDRMSPDLAETIWLRSVVEAEHESRGCLRSWLSFETLLTDWEAIAAKLARDLGLIWPNPPEQIVDDVAGFIKPRLRHRPSAEDRPVISGIALEAREAVDLALRGQEGAARQTFDAVRGTLRDLDRLSSRLVTVALEEIEAPRRRSFCWRLMRPFYRLEQAIRRRLSRSLDDATSPPSFVQ
jgi:hypothetical protein